MLVVDDNESSLTAVEAALAPLGRRLVLARSGVEALARLLEQDFALILLDVAMPGMDGFEVARLVRCRERNRATPIIFITGLSWQDDLVSRSDQLGAFDFMTKPVRAELLRAKARVFVELQERTLALRESETRAHQRELEDARRRFEAQAMERQMQQLAESDRRKDEFLAILAHELRNPLQPLQTAVELLRNHGGKPAPELVQVVDRQLHHMTRLVDDLLDVARFAAHKLELRRRPVAIHTVIEEAVASCQGAIDARQHELVVHASSRAAIVDGDPVRLVQVLCNLLHNAAKYTDHGGRIEVRWGTEGSQAFVRVIDTGRGISSELLPTIFEMFVGQRTAIDGNGGLGLGLGLVKRLVELHGGTVTGASPGAGQGSVFEVRLPLCDESRVESTTLESRRAARAARGPLKLVVCDDAPDVRDLVARMLRSHGHAVTAVADGVAAVRAIIDDRPNVALVDIGLPGMNGYEVARVIRRELPSNRPRLIAMTGYGQASNRASALDAGFDAHIVKPATSEKILGALGD